MQNDLCFKNCIKVIYLREGPYCNNTEVRYISHRNALKKSFSVCSD